MKKDTSPALPGVFMSFCVRCLFEKGGVQNYIIVVSTLYDTCVLSVPSKAVDPAITPQLSADAVAPPGLTHVHTPPCHYEYRFRWE